MVTADPALISHSLLRCGNVLQLIFVAIKMCFSFVVLTGRLTTFPSLDKCHHSIMAVSPDSGHIVWGRLSPLLSACKHPVTL